MMGRLFAYGTLMIPDIFAAVTGRSLRGRDAALAGFARYRVRARVFPGLIEDPSGNTDGVLYTGLTNGDWQCLDSFESHFYERRIVAVSVGAGDILDAYAYVIARRFRAALTNESWDCEHFRHHHLIDYLNRVRLSR